MPKIINPFKTKWKAIGREARLNKVASTAAPRFVAPKAQAELKSQLLGKHGSKLEQRRFNGYDRAASNARSAREAELNATFNGPGSAKELNRIQRRMGRTGGRTPDEVRREKVVNKMIYEHTDDMYKAADAADVLRKPGKTSVGTSNIQTRLADYKAKKSAASAGSGKFTYNGRNRYLTDNGVVSEGSVASRPVNGSSNVGKRSTTDPNNINRRASNLNLTPGGKPQENMWGQTKASAAMGWDNLSTEVASKYNGNYASFLAGATMKGAVWGGAIGGTLSAAQGGDFWSGAKEGAFKGAAIGGGYRALKAATKGNNLGEVMDNGKAIWAYHGKGPGGAVSSSASSVMKLNHSVNSHQVI